jgi:hypothetical protein
VLNRTGGPTLRSITNSVASTHTVVKRRTHRNMGTSTTRKPMNAHPTLATNNTDANRDLSTQDDKHERQQVSVADTLP